LGDKAVLLASEIPPARRVCTATLETASQDRANIVETASRDRANIVETASQDRTNIVETASRDRTNIVETATPVPTDESTADKQVNNKIFGCKLSTVRF
jgi:hypothetical protein